ncbi:hypothetical protein COCNU_14G004640 [Cocos nucifera]|uniref:Uncharacterized protein n=1 Tax=Cocos nucifera TaxID=13894 RepID=A0A8K0IUM4_COCNU|nr:hypothetical protein COCNU_14G004640 [Cocos nucifera]
MGLEVGKVEISEGYMASMGGKGVQVIVKGAKKPLFTGMGFHNLVDNYSAAQTLELKSVDKFQ